MRRSLSGEVVSGTRRPAGPDQFAPDDGWPAGRVTALRLRRVRIEKDASSGRREVVPVSDAVTELPCDLALLAIGFTGVAELGLLDGLGLARNPRGTIDCGPDWQTDAPGVFVCGDAHRGASLIVWAIAEGRAAARAVDVHLTGTSSLPAPVRTTTLPLTAHSNG